MSPTEFVALLERAYREGLEAYRQGATIKEAAQRNPHRGRAGGQWMNGWMVAQHRAGGTGR